ncbi:MAG: nuclear transport factor 2 family protein [Dinghuibacter sp.]|nr:nuclear transport factor 2 family protein [Dinghuibacter sp.]
MYRFVLFLFILTSCSGSRKTTGNSFSYTPADGVLYETITRYDSLFFHAYNNCKLEVMDSLLSENIEFYHDRGGLSTSKKGLLEALKNNICGKVTRELKPGSIEVYAINNYGAVEMGLHRFHNNREPEPKHHPFARFVQIWKHDNGKWSISRVISLH